MERELDMILFRDPEIFADIFGHRWRGSSREGENTGYLQLPSKVGQFEVVGSEVVAPFRDAVSLIDCEKRDVHALEMIPEILISKTLGRDIKKFEAPIQHVSLNGLDLFEGQRGVQSCCSNTMAYQSIDLIFHQCDERRYHHR